MNNYKLSVTAYFAVCTMAYIWQAVRLHTDSMTYGASLQYVLASARQNIDILETSSQRRETSPQDFVREDRWSETLQASTIDKSTISADDLCRMLVHGPRRATPVTVSCL